MLRDHYRRIKNLALTADGFAEARRLGGVPNSEIVDLDQVQANWREPNHFALGCRDFLFRDDDADAVRSAAQQGSHVERLERLGAGHFSIAGTTITLETIGGGQPDQMIGPFVVDGGAYPNANPGSLGGGNFDPYVIGPATFTLNLPGVTANTTITPAMFSFGTSKR